MHHPHVVGEQSFVFGKGRSFVPVVAQGAVAPPGGYPQPAPAVPDKRAEADPVQQLQQIRGAQLLAGGGPGRGQRQGGEGPFLIQGYESGVSGHEEQAVVDTGGVDHPILKTVVLEHV